MERLRSWTRQHLAFVEQHLSAFPYFAGQSFTAADVMMVFPFTTLMRFRTLDLAPYPSMRSYRQRIEGRPAYQRAMERAGPDRKPD